jgi:hypothetical protein
MLTRGSMTVPGTCLPFACASEHIRFTARSQPCNQLIDVCVACDDDDNSSYEDDYTGWTWDDPIDMEGDHAWDEEWVPERDDSFNGMLNATWTALDTHVAPSLSQQATYSKAMVRAGVSQVLNIEDHPRNYVRPHSSPSPCSASPTRR